MATDIMATDIMATSTTELTLFYSILLTRFIRFALASLKLRLASLGAVSTWKSVCWACIDATEFRLAATCGLNIIIAPDHLDDLIGHYEQRGYFTELMQLMEQVSEPQAKRREPRAKRVKWLHPLPN